MKQEHKKILFRFHMKAPYDLNYRPIKVELDKSELDENIGFAEPCLSEKHRIDLK